MAKAYSIRESLQGSLLDYVRESGFENTRTEELVRELVSLLASYREEDYPLFPEVYVFASQQGLRALSPTARSINLGSAAVEGGTARRMLKDCASLANRGWAVYAVHASGAELQYGIFRSKRHSFAMPAEESLVDLGMTEPVLMLRNRGHLTVELVNGVNDKFTVALTTKKAEPSQLGEASGRLAEAIASEVSDQGGFEPFIKRFLIETVQKCHGTLVAVIGASNVPPGESDLSDGVWLNPPLDVAGSYSEARGTSTAEALADLQAAEILLEGMINSDGVVVFDTRGRVLAYRVFLRPKDNERARIPDDGGGRRRTFELMKIRLGTLLEAAFFRSQDGETQCQRKPK